MFGLVASVRVAVPNQWSCDKWLYNYTGCVVLHAVLKQEATACAMFELVRFRQEIWLGSCTAVLAGGAHALHSQVYHKGPVHRTVQRLVCIMQQHFFFSSNTSVGSLISWENCFFVWSNKYIYGRKASREYVLWFQERKLCCTAPFILPRASSEIQVTGVSEIRL